MGKDTRVSDWQFAGILSLGASVGLAGGGWVFSFKSMQASYREDFVMLGVGVGTPGTTVEISLPKFQEGDLSWSPIVCEKPFSASDLHCSGGMIGTIGASVGVGYSRLYASASQVSRPAAKSPAPAVSAPNNPAETRWSYLTEAENLRRFSLVMPGISSVPQKAAPPKHNGGILFAHQVNDGLGVIDEKAVTRAASDGLMEAAGKAGKRFKPALSLGAMAVAGMWFGIGSVVSEAMAAAGYVVVSVLSGGLLQAGEALLSGRGINVLREFAKGYAIRLADMTAPSSAITNAHYNKLKYLDWKSDLATYGQKHVDGGSRAPVSSLPEIGLAGEAAILQAVHRYVDAKGEDAWYDAKKKHRGMWGEDESARKNIYEKALYRQIDNASPLGFLPANQFLP